MSGVAQRLEVIRARMADACLVSGRSAGEAGLLAVSKTFPAAAVAEAMAAGQVDFGESRQQEGARKIAELPDAIRWHFIGKLQRNKVRKVLADFSCLHSIDSLKLAEHTDRIAGELGLRPAVFLEINLAGEDAKSGFSVDQLRCEMAALVELRNLELRGLMAIPPAVDDPELTRPWFVMTRELRDDLERDSGKPLPGLSMGMSGDYEVAIEEGATMVRVGSAIFGGRDYD